MDRLLRACYPTSLIPRLLTVWLGALPLVAHASTNMDLYALSLQELMEVKVTTSTLHDETLKSVPSSMTVYTRDDIHRLGLTNLNQLINLVPGYQGNRTDDSTLSFSLSSRGRRIGSTGREVLVLINGQRMNNDWNGGAGQHSNLIPIENIERVEFIRGPGSSLYGSNAMTGVINIITRSDREVVAETGNNGHRHASAQWQAQNALGSVELYARDTRSDGESLTLFEPFPNPATPEHIESGDPFRANDLYLRTKAGEFSLQGIATSRDAQQYYVAGYADNLTNSYDTRANHVNAGWEHAFNSNLTLEGHVFQSERQLAVVSAVALVPYLVLEGSLNERELGTEWVLQGSQPSSHWLLGWEWRNPRLSDTKFYFGPPENRFATASYQAPEDGRYIRGMFGQYQQDLSDSLELIAGIRHDSYSDFGNHTSPRLGLVQQASDTDIFKLLYSEAFRPPNRMETSVISPEYQSNPELAPETANTGELIWIHLFGQNYIATTLFNTQIDDAVIEGITPELKRTWLNGEVRVSGLETEWQYHWNQQWQSRLALTRLFGEKGDVDTESDSLLSGSVSYESNGWTLSLLTNYQSDKLDSNEQDFPADITTTEYTHFGGRTLYGAHLSHQVMKALELYLHADNLFDKQYLSPASRAPNAEGAPGNGRLVTAGLRWTLD